MAACQARKLALRKPRPSEVIQRVQAGYAEEAYTIPVRELQQCSLPMRHRGEHDFRSARWLRVRATVRVSVVLIIVAAFVIIGGMDSPNLH